MLYTLKGKLISRGDGFLVVEVGSLTGGLGFKVFTNNETLSKLPQDSLVELFCFLYIRDDQMELYGFLEEQALKLFEMLNAVVGIGPKTALGILDVDTVPNLMAAIIEKRTELLSRTSGIGRKTAERIILELHSKIKLPEAKTLTEKMDVDIEVEEALTSLGYSRSQVKRVLSEAGGEAKTLEERLKQALRLLGRSK
ncbi:MAG: Holliday junction branch migration protein RuvA [Patescibacteria group bacterium]|nr:Holliday junction branch migration protein RuvA [Patescibacteria group bacterium]